MSDDEFSKVRVLDLSSGIAGAYCAKMFADAGATVTLAEPAAGHPLRSWSCVGDVAAGDDGALVPLPPARSTVGHRSHRCVAVGDARRSRVGDHRRHRARRGNDCRSSRIGGAAPRSRRRRHLALRLRRSVRPPRRERAHDSGRQRRLAIRGRPDRPPIQAGGQVTEWVTGAYAAVAGMAALTRAFANRPRRADRRQLVRGRQPHVHVVRRSLRGRRRTSRFSGAPSATHVRDAVDRTDARRMRRLQHQQPPAVRRLPRADRAPRPARRRDVGARCPGAIERWDEWNEIVHGVDHPHTTADIVERAALLRIPVAPVYRRPRWCCDSSSRQPRRARRRPDRHVHDAAPAVDDRRRAGRRRRARPRARRAHRHDRAARARPDVDPRPPAPRPRCRSQGVQGRSTSPRGGRARRRPALLAALGADVIHVESVSRPDGMRMTGGVFADRDEWWELSAFFLAVEHQQARPHPRPRRRPRAATLLLRPDRAARRRWSRTSRRGCSTVRPRLGRRSTRANPRAVMVRMPAFGLDGPVARPARASRRRWSRSPGSRG